MRRALGMERLARSLLSCVSSSHRSNSAANFVPLFGSRVLPRGKNQKSSEGPCSGFSQELSQIFKST